MPEQAVRTLLMAIGEDPDRPGLVDTPARFVKALREMTAGYQSDPATVLSRQFDLASEDPPVAYDGVVILKDIGFNSMCEHHMLPFMGVAHVAYVPGESGIVVGLSKLARVVDVLSRRLQVQERLTVQIAESLMGDLKAAGALVVIEASHQCMEARGALKPGASMITIESRGLMVFTDNRREAMLLMGVCQ